MFTGIIQQMGTVEKVSKKDELLLLEIKTPIAKNKKIGDSISIDGACYTITSLHDDLFSTEVIPETQDKTICSQYKPGTKVNLEEPLKVGDELNGHFVSGHIDFVGKILKLEKDANTKILTIQFPEAMEKFFALKGSVSLNGVSLTISNLEKGELSVSLIPETLKKTNLGAVKEGDFVNVEVDLISRYLDSLMKDKEKQASYEFLLERGFL